MIASQKLGMLMPKRPQRRAEIIDPGVRFRAGPDTQRNRQQGGDDDGKTGQLDGRRQPALNDSEHGLGVFKRFAKVAGRR